MTKNSEALLIALLKDADNWSGTPMIGAGAGPNVKTTPETRGNLTQLKMEGYIRTFDDRGCTFVTLLAPARQFAAEQGIEVEDHWFR